MNNKLKIAVYTKIDDDINGIFLADEYIYSSDKCTQSAFDNWYSDDNTYDFDRWYGENNWDLDAVDEDTQVLFIDNNPNTVVKLVHIHVPHVSE